VSDQAFERLKFLIDKCYEETRLHWIRGNILLILNVASLGFVLRELVQTDEPRLLILACVSVLGIFLCTIWFHFNHRSRSSYILLKKDIQHLLETNSALQQTFKNWLWEGEEKNNDKDSDSQVSEEKVTYWALFKCFLQAAFCQIKDPSVKETRIVIMKGIGIATWAQYLARLVLWTWAAVLLYTLYCRFVSKHLNALILELLCI